MYPIPRILSNALRNPRQTPNLMLFQLDITIKHPIMELLEECLLIQMHLHGEEAVFQSGCQRRDIARGTITRRMSPAPARRGIEERAILWHHVADSPHLVNVVCPGKRVIPFRIETSDGRKESRPLFF